MNQKHLALLLTIIAVPLLSVLCLKYFYFGTFLRKEASPPGFQIVADRVFSFDPRTWIHRNSRDSDQGYYRIYDSTGKKVFEIYSDRLSFDVVLATEHAVEFQLESKTHHWSVPTHQASRP